MNEVKEKIKEQLLDSLNELEHLVKTNLTTVASKPSKELEEKLFSLEEKFQLMNEKNKKVYDVLEKVIDELEDLLTNEESKCPQ